MIAIEDDDGDQRILDRLLANLGEWNVSFTAYADPNEALDRLRRDCSRRRTG